jgi:hypothetical protein
MVMRLIPVGDKKTTFVLLTSYYQSNQKKQT